MKKVLFFLITAVSFTLFGQSEQHSEDWYLLEANKAIQKENYEYALSLLDEGKKLYPDSFRLIEKTGDLYFDKELYSLALESYRDAEVLQPDSGSVIYDLGSTLGRLNENEEAITYYEKLLGYEAYHKRAVDDLSWLYYKVHRLKDSEKLLLDEMKKGFNRNYAITLGTVYSDMYDYQKSKKYYLMSIEDARKDGAHYFASVALYNLSLLEYSFYNYEESLKDTEESLDEQDRSSGHLSRGELLQLAGRYREAEKEYAKAESMDTTPLSRIALGELYQKTGHLAQALALMKDVAGRRDMSWMYFFGTDRDQHAMDLSEPFRDIYKAMAEYEKHRLVSSPVDWLKSLYNRIRYRILSFYNDQIYRKAARAVGDNNRGGSELNSWWAYSRAAMGNRPAFMHYILLCQAFEKKLSDRSVPWYMLEIGRETDNYNLLEKALPLFRPDWEAEPLMETLVNLIHLEKRGRGEIRRNRINSLYKLNSGDLMQHDIGLPIVLEADGSGNRRIVKRYLKRTGFEVADRAGKGFEHKLIVHIGDGKWSWYLLGDKGEILYQSEGKFDKLNRAVYRKLVMSVFDSVYAYTF